MKFVVDILRERSSKVFEIIDVNDFDLYYIKDIASIEEDAIWEYNDVFSKIIAKHERSIEYLISPTLTRIEGATLFYDSICRYICCLKLIEKRQCNISFVNLDFQLARALSKFLKNTRVKFKHNGLRLFMYEFRIWIELPYRAFRMIFRKVFLICLCRIALRMPAKRSYDYAFRTFYDDRSYKEEKHRDEYFEPLLKWLIGKGKRVIIFNHLYPDSIRRFPRYLREISKSNDYPNSVKERYIGLGALFLCILFGISKRPRIHEKINFRGHEISYLTQLSLKRDFWDLGWIDTYLEYFCAKNIFKTFSIGQIFYSYENHPWEKALILARNELSKSTKVVAFQHSSLNYKVLQYFPGKHERNLGFFPDRILTVGKILKRILETKGHYSSGLIEEGCALRHAYLFEEVPIIKCKEKARKIAYAFSFDSKTYLTILQYLAEIFKDKKYTVYLKFHPDVVFQLGLKYQLPENFIDARYIPWKQIFNEVDILLYDGNSLGIEALKYNIAVGYFPLTGQLYNTDHLFEYGDNKIVIDSVRTGRLFLERFYAEDYPDSFEKGAAHNRQYVREFFSPITEENLSRFL